MLRLFKALLLGLLATLAGQAGAQDYPAKPIKVVVPFGPGSASDFVTRLLANHLSTSLNQSVITDNRPGVGGAMGSEYAAKQPTDGYTLLLGSQGPLVIAPALQQGLPYNVTTDFVPVTSLVWSPQAFVVPADAPYNDIQSLIKFAKANPGKVQYGSPVASAQHLIISTFATRAGIQLTHVPYKGSVPAVTDLLASRIQLVTDSITVVLPYVRGGKLKALGVTPNTRLQQLPDVPTINEQGVPFNFNNWQVILAPTGTPPAVLAKLDTEIRKVLARGDVQKLLVDQGFSIMTMPREAISDYLKLEQAEWRKIVAASGVKIE